MNRGEEAPKPNGQKPAFADATGYGLTKREYFAAALMAGSLTNPALFEAVGAGCQGVPQEMYKAFAVGAVAMADQLLEALKK